MKKERNNQIKTIIFDVGGVLALPNYPVKLIQDTHLAGVPLHCGHRNLGVHEYLANKLKIILDQWFDSIDTIYAQSIEGKVSEKKVLSTISKNLRISSRKIEKLVIHAYKLNFTQNKQLYKFAFKLKKQGYKIAILSDQWHLSKKALILPKYSKKFDSVIISCDVGVRKPNPKIYKLLLKKLKFKPSQCIFIDNQQWNIAPAKKFGFKTILYKNNKQLFKQLEKYLV